MPTLSRKVICPASETKETKTVFTGYTFLDGKFFPAPCGGCDDMNGSTACEKCCADVTIYYLNNPPTREELSPSPIFIDPLLR